jgi:hypothetical protein
MLRMYMINGNMFTVPEIKDANKKENKDIRRFFGPPRISDAASADSPKKGEQKKADETRSGQSSDARSKESRLRNAAQLSSLAFMSLPLAVVFFRLRRRR